MCFSATASFVAAGVLTGIGATGLYLNKKQEYLMLGLIPLLFAIQQAAEGIVWLTISSPAHQHLHLAAAYIFLAFAGVVWPLWTPLALFMAEKEHTRRTILAGLSFFGAIVSCYVGWLLLTEPVNPQVVSCSISYNFADTIAMPFLVGLACYCLAAVGPCFVSSIWHAPTFGSLLLVSLLISHIFKEEALGSVWCFCAAVLSVLVVVGIRKDQETLR